ESGRQAAVGKLLANLALAVSAQGLREALALGEATGTSAEETLDMLGGTGLAFIAGMKGPFVRGERTTEGGDFTANAIAKDARLMIDTVAGTTGDAASDDAGPRPGADLPALRGALASLEAQIAAGGGRSAGEQAAAEEGALEGVVPVHPAAAEAARLSRRVEARERSGTAARRAALHPPAEIRLEAAEGLAQQHVQAHRDERPRRRVEQTVRGGGADQPVAQVVPCPAQRRDLGVLRE